MNANQALQEKFVDHLPKIRRIVSRIAKNEGIVDDITQEAFVRIIEKENLWNKKPNQFLQWMNTVTRNLTKDYLKKKKERSLEGTEECLLFPEVGGFSEEQIEWVVKQFCSLSEKQRQVLNMRYYQNMTVTQIGKELGITQQTASHHINMALKTLRKKAKSQGLLAILLPWNWDLKTAMRVVEMGGKTKVFIIVIVTFLFLFIWNSFDTTEVGLDVKNLILVNGNSSKNIQKEYYSKAPIKDNKIVNKKNPNKLEVNVRKFVIGIPHHYSNP